MPDTYYRVHFRDEASEALKTFLCSGVYTFRKEFWQQQREEWMSEVSELRGSLNF